MILILESFGKVLQQSKRWEHIFKNLTDIDPSDGGYNVF